MNSYLKKENAKAKNGSALIVVLCVLAVLMALSAALLVSTRSIINNNAKYTDVIQCKLLNQTLGKALSEQIIGVTDNELGLAISKRIESGWTAEQVEIIEIDDMKVLDTPGFSSLSFLSYNLESVKNAFIEFKNFPCVYKDCNHDKEPECNLKKAVEENLVLKSRYDNYLNFKKEFERK